MNANVEFLWFHDVEAVESFAFLGMRYGIKCTPQRVLMFLQSSSFQVKLQIAVLQLYINWTSIIILEQAIAFQKGIKDPQNSWDRVPCNIN